MSTAWFLSPFIYVVVIFCDFCLSVVVVGTDGSLLSAFWTLKGRPRFFLMAGNDGGDPGIFVTIIGESFYVKYGIGLGKKGSILSNVV
jgi:hypothetical protein